MSEFPKEFTASYGSEEFLVTLCKDNDSIGVGTVLLTSAGEQLSRLCFVEPVEGFLEYVAGEFAEYATIITEYGPIIPRPKSEGLG